MLRTLFAPMHVLCLYPAGAMFLKEEFTPTAEWPVAIACTLTSLVARAVINFSMPASLSSGSLRSYVTGSDGSSKLTLALSHVLLGKSASTPSSAASQLSIPEVFHYMPAGLPHMCNKCPSCKARDRRPQPLCVCVSECLQNFIGPFRGLDNKTFIVLDIKRISVPLNPRIRTR